MDTNLLRRGKIDWLVDWLIDIFYSESLVVSNLSAHIDAVT